MQGAIMLGVLMFCILGIFALLVSTFRKYPLPKDDEECYNEGVKNFILVDTLGHPTGSEADDRNEAIKLANDCGWSVYDIKEAKFIHYS